MRRDEERLADILAAIDKIERFTREGRSAFDEDERTQVWVLYHIQLIGEAARALSEDLRSHHPEVPWTAIIGMRHILVHDYFGIDQNEVWAAVERDLPELRKQILDIQEAEP